MIDLSLPPLIGLERPAIIRPAPDLVLLAMLPGLVPSIAAAAQSFDPPGSQTWEGSSVSTWNRLVPNYENSLTIELFGAGGAGAVQGGDNSQNGLAGSASTCTEQSMSAGGGAGGTRGSSVPSTTAGGTASGGEINTTGGSGSRGSNSGSSGNAGSGGAAANGGPGFGGDGLRRSPGSTSFYAAGGGGGAYCASTFALGELTPGATISGNVGQRGVNTETSAINGGYGRVKVTWT